MITAIIDADPFVYAAGFAVERTHYIVNTKSGKFIHKFEGKASLNTWLKENEKKESDFTIEKEPVLEPVQSAYNILDGQMAAIQKYFQAEQMLLFLTDDRRGYNFREYLAAQRKYKDRPSNKRPAYYDALRTYMVEKMQATMITGFEADDAVAMQAYAASYYEDSEVVIVSIDKDLRMVPGRHYNPDKKVLDKVTPREGMHNFFIQLLTGDTVDTIPGVPRVGPKKAEVIYSECDTEEDYLAAAMATYHKAFGDAGPNILVETARLVWMLRYAGDVWLPEGQYLKEFLK